MLLAHIPYDLLLFTLDRCPLPEGVQYPQDEVL
jgi:hypothetical protein